jgi:tetratricopeptide (TPR) repeat protein
MNKGSTPDFFVALDLLIHAFHLEQEPQQDPQLRSGGFEAHLAGRRPDIKDQRLRTLLNRFATALLASQVLPELPATLHWDVHALPHPTKRRTSTPAPAPTDVLVECLHWLGQRHEELLGEARSQHAATALDSAFGLQPLVRFAAHHLVVALGWLWHAGLVTDEILHADATTMTWCQERPSRTPLQDLAAQLDLTLKDLHRRRLLETDEKILLNEKTLENLWNGGNEHPDFDTIHHLVTKLVGDDVAERARWRRWWGLRYLATKAARLWGWDWTYRLVGAVIHDADQLADVLTTAEQPQDDPAVIGLACWSGWHHDTIRRYAQTLARDPAYNQHPTWHLDIEAIGKGAESLRVQACLQIAASIPPLERHLIERGADPKAARAQALEHFWEQQGGSPGVAHLDPAEAMNRAKLQGDWLAMERAARQLVELRPQYPDNHIALSAALLMLNRHEEALEADRNGQHLHPESRDLRMHEIVILLDRGQHSGRMQDFEVARELLTKMGPPPDDADAHLHLADCLFAMGNWSNARDACKQVIRARPECGEAHAMASICSAKLEDQRSANKYSEWAEARGALAFLTALRKRDAEGGLLGRWHRCSNPS